MHVRVDKAAVVALGTAVMCTVVVVLWAGDVHTALGDSDPGRLTGVMFGLVRTTASAAGTVTAGALVFGAFVVPGRRDGRLTPHAYAAIRIASIERLQARGHRAAMVGDGINDGPALAAADLGMAMARRSEIASHAADVILVRDDLTAVPDAVVLAGRTLATIRGNLWWAFGYNTAALPLAALGLLNPLIAGAAMSLSPVPMVANSLRLRNQQPGSRAPEPDGVLQGASAHNGPTTALRSSTTPYPPTAERNEAA